MKPLRNRTLHGAKDVSAAFPGWSNSLQESGGSDAVSAALAEERKEIERYGSNSACQTGYIQNLLNGHVSTCLKSKESGSQTFPDFSGTRVMDGFSKCVKLSAVYRAKTQTEETSRQTHAGENERAYCEEIRAFISDSCYSEEPVRYYDDREVGAPGRLPCLREESRHIQNFGGSFFG